MKAAVLIDDYKVQFFEENLKAAGFTWTKSKGLTKDTTMLTVVTDEAQRLGQLILKLNKEFAAKNPGYNRG